MMRGEYCAYQNAEAFRSIAAYGTDHRHRQQRLGGWNRS
jgi:hypothetical protein